MKQTIKQNIHIVGGLIIGFAIAYNFCFQLGSHDRMLIDYTIGITGILTYCVIKRLEGLEHKRYECFFRKDIIACDTSDTITTLGLHCFLPIQPHVGIAICDEKLCSKEQIIYSSDFRKFYTGTILQINWFGESNTYTCETESYKMKQGETLGEVIAKFCDHAWDFDNDDETVEALEKYVLYREDLINQKDQNSDWVLEETDRLRRIKNKLKPVKQLNEISTADDDEATSPEPA